MDKRYKERRKNLDYIILVLNFFFNYKGSLNLIYYGINNYILFKSLTRKAMSLFTPFGSLLSLVIIFTNSFENKTTQYLTIRHNMQSQFGFIFVCLVINLCTAILLFLQKQYNIYRALQRGESLKMKYYYQHRN